MAPVVAVEAAEVGRRAATTEVSETMVTTEMTVAGSTAVEAMAVGVETAAVVEEAISRRTTPNRYVLKRTTEIFPSANLRMAEVLKGGAAAVLTSGGRRP